MPHIKINNLYSVLMTTIIVLLLVIVFYLAEDYQVRQTADRADAAGWLRQQQLIYRLKSCVDDSIKPCEIDTAY
jgi:hypothetical protein